MARDPAHSPALDTPFWRRLLSPPRISRWNAVSCAAAGLIWVTLIQSRAHLIAPHCITTAASCSAAAVNAVDQMAVHLEFGLADGISFWLQNFAIFMGLFAPLALALLTHRTATLQKRLRQGLTDLMLWIESVFWNGAVMELTRIATHRPRPFVLKDPIRLGTEAAHYTSFFSGHTSFVATSWTALLLIALTRRASTPVTVIAFLAWAMLPGAEAYFRILAGRHYFSDTAVGWFVGILMAVGIAWMRRDKSLRYS